MKPFVVLEPVLRSLPSDWQVVPLRRVSHLSINVNTSGKEPLLSLTSAGELILRHDDKQPPSIDYLSRYGVVSPGDLVVNPMWLNGGGIAVARRCGAVSPEYRIYRFAPNILPRFAHYLLRSTPYLSQYRLLLRANTTFDRRVTKDDFHALPIVVPPWDTQLAIVKFLDAGTARIDSLLGMKRLLVERLEQWYRSYRQTAVLRGLDPTTGWGAQRLGGRQVDSVFWSVSTADSICRPTHERRGAFRLNPRGV